MFVPLSLNALTLQESELLNLASSLSSVSLSVIPLLCHPALPSQHGKEQLPVSTWQLLLGVASLPGRSEPRVREGSELSGGQSLAAWEPNKSEVERPMAAAQVQPHQGFSFSTQSMDRSSSQFCVSLLVWVRPLTWARSLGLWMEDLRFEIRWEGHRDFQVVEATPEAGAGREEGPHPHPAARPTSPGLLPGPRARFPVCRGPAQQPNPDSRCGVPQSFCRL